MTDHYITYGEYIICYLNRFAIIKDLINTLTLFRSKFDNYLTVLWNNKNKKYPIIGKLKNEKNVSIANLGELMAILYNFSYDSVNDIVSLKSLDHEIKLSSAIRNGEILGIFLKSDYEFLKVDGKIVIDVGANIADSSIYFALNGAAKVVALEPFPRNADIAKRNIRINNLNSKIILLEAGCSSFDHKILVDQGYEGVYKSASSTKLGQPVELLALRTLVDRFQIESAVLKMDCEGCEYDVILNTPNDILRKFLRIQIEYHYGYSSLKKKLQSAGFKIAITRPRYRKNEFVERSTMIVGWLYAERSDPINA